jgi:hypothetical protein
MPPSSTLPKTIGIVLIVDAIALMALPVSASESDEKQHCKIFDRFSSTSPNVGSFTTLVNVNDTLIWNVEVDVDSAKEGYSAYLFKVYTQNKKLTTKQDYRRSNGIVKGVIKSDFTNLDETTYRMHFKLRLNNRNARTFIIDPKLKGTKTTAIINTGG